MGWNLLDLSCVHSVGFAGGTLCIERICSFRSLDYNEWITGKHNQGSTKFSDFMISIIFKFCIIDSIRENPT